MKRMLLFSACLFCCIIISNGQNIGFNDNNSDPHASAIVDIYSTSKGMLIPRVSLDSTLLATPVTNPATSLLVYNTAAVHDVIPGYYYWDGAKWNRLETSSDQEIYFDPVTKSADATLLKTETLVLASGNISLTLPTISESDNGLKIIVKHVGLHTDLIKIKPSAGQKIDANDSIMLTRWNGKAFLAYNGNWFLETKDSRADNLLDVSATGSFTTIEEVVEFLDAHMCRPVVVRLGAGEYDLDETITIDLPFPVTFQGLSFGATIINCPSGDTAFNLKSECYFKMLTMYGGETPGVGIDLSGEDVYYEIKDGYLYGFSKGIVISNAADIWLFEVDFDSCTVAGVEIAAPDTAKVVFRTSECDYYNCDIANNLVSAGEATEISILSSTFYNFTIDQIGINYLPPVDNNNFRFASMIIQNNSFNNIGNFCSGFDFSRTDGRDANVFMENNAGYESKAPHCKINVANNTTWTTITSANTWYKYVGFSNYNSTTTKWTIGNNRITYQTENIRDAVIFLSGNVKTNSTSARVINIAIVKNGNSTTRYGETTIRIPSSNANQSFPWSTNVYVENMDKTDYLELWITSASSGDVLTIDDLNWYTSTH